MGLDAAKGGGGAHDPATTPPPAPWGVVHFSLFTMAYLSVFVDSIASSAAFFENESRPSSKY
jgi:hypothetical protein